jgi:hypothetical protein
LLNLTWNKFMPWTPIRIEHPDQWRMLTNGLLRHVQHACAHGRRQPSPVLLSAAQAVTIDKLTGHLESEIHVAGR